MLVEVWFTNVKYLNKHKYNKHRNYCKECGQILNKNTTLHSHKSIEHEETLEVEQQKYNCRLCEKSFSNREQLQKHLATEHRSSRQCEYFVNCQFSKNLCRFDHEIRTKEKVDFKLCRLECLDLNRLKVHRKKSHQSSVKTCDAFQENKCKFNNDCFYIHQSNEERKMKMPECPFGSTCNVLKNSTNCRFKHSPKQNPKNIKTQVFCQMKRKQSQT